MSDLIRITTAEAETCLVVGQTLKVVKSGLHWVEFEVLDEPGSPPDLGVAVAEVLSLEEKLS